MKEFGLPHGSNSQEDLQLLMSKRKMQVDDHRIKSLPFYNILDHPDYIAAKKIEKRIIRYYKQDVNKS